MFHVEHKHKFALCVTFSTASDVPKKTEGIRARLPEELRARLDAIHKAHLTNDSTVTVHMLEAFCDYVEKTGAVKLPIQIIPAQERLLQEQKAPKRVS